MERKYVGVNVTVNATGAAAAAKQGQLVMVVDVIDMSTTLEAALDAGAIAVFGASPDNSRAPVKLDPKAIGMEAGAMAVEHGTDVILISEPRVGTDEERLQRASKAVSGIVKARAKIGAVVPNNGAETAKLVDFSGRVVLAVTDTGGVAYDAARTAGAPAVITGTIARTMMKRGSAPAEAAAERACKLAGQLGVGITVVAATANSLEDILAAEHIARLIIEQGFTKLK